jgi:hypothetical protein
LHVGAVTPVLDDDELVRLGVLAEHAVAGDGCLDEFLRLGGRQLVGSEIFGHVDAAGVGIRVFGVDDLEVRAVLADAERHAVRNRTGVELAGVDLAEVVDDVAQAAWPSDPK